eukprot:CAMPEP_0119008822 /NCGR_PEP_ID=MMETSP1176-20130426/3965_1 /TAXON_ID=265551 /ORGANISM="Synedropsis recta cf, Strain CCMP1620" /LENGTH=470 /DNA_ID=CAMNT_0006961231 /DNA_START=31 /DNA_END=1439 /DNA_ORIENTATION=+
MVSFLTAIVTLTTSFSPTSLAFQSSSGVAMPSKQMTDVIRTPQSPGLFMSAEAYDFKQPRPFTMPLMQDSSHVVQEFDDNTRRGVSNTIHLQEDDDDSVIDYLPWFVLQHLQTAAPAAKHSIAQATRQHVFGDTRSDPKVNVADVLSMIAEEFKCADVPVVIGGKTYSVERDQRHRQVVRILSFAAYHRLPKEITALLFGDDDELLTVYKEAFLTSGWTDVMFPRGLAIRLPRNRLTSRLDRYQPIPRRWRMAHNCRIADRSTKEAARVQAPPRRLLSREAFLDSLHKEMAASSTSGTSRKKYSLRDGLPFFPTSKVNMFRNVRRYITRTMGFFRIGARRLKQSIRATLLSYSILAFCWYNISLLWRWQGLSATYAFSSTALQSSLQRVGSVMIKAYSGFASAPITMLLLALGLAPIAHKALRSVQSRLGNDDPNKTLLMVGSLLTVAHIGIGTGILFLDAALLRSVMGV